ncbi:MAG: DUF1178 family protein [Rhodospirillum sp.]|nr:DUF1178 family protein [Rhodospirillum sp.]MCF8488276.1 DUF1178 family protein [Rhodospirillum sp.]MCF8500068.1 DUF1178 family protein [Rhodospirillum sp.]
MIRYALVCEHDHDFEGWFRDSATCDDQLSGGAVDCPYCGSHTVTKALMAPNVVSSRSKEGRVPSTEIEPQTAPSPAPEPASAPPANAAGRTGTVLPTLPLGQNTRPISVASGPEGKEALTKLAQAMAKLRAHVEATCEDVGGDFAEEARKIHHGETTDRPIHGEATLDEAKALSEEGIGISLLPWSRRPRN